RSGNAILSPSPSRHALCPLSRGSPCRRFIIHRMRRVELMRNCAWAAGVALVFGLSLPVVAGRPEPVGPPKPVGFEQRTITCYRTEFRTEYREVERTVYRCVPETHEEQITETVLV